MESQSSTRRLAGRQAHDRAAGSPAQLRESAQGMRPDAHPGLERLAEMHATLNGGPRSTQLKALGQSVNLAAAPSGKATGLPDALKAGVEALSGIPMDGVRVHYRSAEPAQLQAHAFTRGADIHIAPGQERHLPHEAWHVVQQRQGRVKPTMQLKGGVPVNDDKGLESEADAMGEAALRNVPGVGAAAIRGRGPASRSESTVQRSVDFNPHQAEASVIGQSGLAGFNGGNISSLAEVLIDRYGVKATQERIVELFSPFLDDETICFRDYPDAAEWVGSRLGDLSDSASPGSGAKGIDAEDFEDAIASTLGEAATPDLVDFYVRQLAIIIGRLERGGVGIRYLSLDRKQGKEVLHRLVQAMVSLGLSQPDPVKFFETQTVILHGSYLFGGSSETPGDIDLIISGGQSKKIGIGGKLDRDPQEPNFSVGSKSGILDFMVGIPLAETEEPTDLSRISGKKIRKDARQGLVDYLHAAEKEADAGKRLRKFVNIAVALDYIMHRLDKESGLKPYIAQANKALLGAKQPRGKDLEAAVEKAFAKL
jgi:hypothetical protein